MNERLTADDVLALLEEALSMSPSEELCGVTVRKIAVVRKKEQTTGLILRLADGSEFLLWVQERIRRKKR